MKILINQNCFGLSVIQFGFEKNKKFQPYFQTLMIPTSQILIKKLECKLKHQLLLVHKGLFSISLQFNSGLESLNYRQFNEI